MQACIVNIFSLELIIIVLECRHNLPCLDGFSLEGGGDHTGELPPPVHPQIHQEEVRSTKLLQTHVARDRGSSTDHSSKESSSSYFSQGRLISYNRDPSKFAKMARV